MTQSYDNDLHANASLMGDQITLGKPLLKQHSHHCDEVISILMHEIGHWKYNHLLKSTFVDTGYMVIFGLLLQFVENSPAFLTAFGFHQESYFASLGLFVWLFMISLDPLLKIAMKAYSRSHETDADTFSTEEGYGVSL